MRTITPSRTRHLLAGIGITMIGLIVGTGCTSQPVARTPIPAASNRAMVRETAPQKPLPPQTAVDDRPFPNEQIIKQTLPGEGQFVQTYRQVGAPRIVLFVNRTLEGNIIPVTDPSPIVSVEHSRTATTGMTVDQTKRTTRDRYYTRTREKTSDHFETQGPGEYHERTAVYLKPGEYDEVWAKSLDYQAVETIMTDWIRSNGAVTVISPIMARGRLTDEQIKDLQSGRPQSTAEIARQLDADILIQLQAHPTRQTPQGVEVRMVAEAISLHGGQSIGQAVVDVPPPLDKVQINKYTRYLAAKLMDDMTQTWLNAPPPPAAEPPAPVTAIPGSPPAPSTHPAVPAP